ncbi:MAG: protein phosphatase 2C domain-containing protein [Duncaniella sp.]|nr:protein phosphatase 2C domain-containing protein [Duncaniella sp.]
MTRRIRYEVVCDTGRVRANNEDMAYAAGRFIRDGIIEGETETECTAFAVADGMGGHEGGGIASEIVCRSFASFIKTINLRDEASVIQEIKTWAKDANRLVTSTATLRSGISEMGTTFISLIFTCGKAFLLNVGDSRCYRLRSGILKRLSTDHSERARTGNPELPSNLIYNFMGKRPDEFFSDLSVLTPLPGDRYILCSDGLTDMLSDEEIEVSGGDVKLLLDKAMRAGGQDNITVIAIDV